MQYDKAKYKIWALPHPLILHWILNPGIAFNELILGQRLPKVMLIDKESDKPLAERSYVPCPHCGTMHDGRLWSWGKKNAFGHWFGYVCPACEKIIPCLWNVFSLAILTVLFPVWILPGLLLKKKWLSFEKMRLSRLVGEPFTPARNVRWIKNGVLYFGVSLWIGVGVIPQVWSVLNGKDANFVLVFLQLPIWLVAGLLWGLAMQFWMNKKGKAGQNTAVGADKPRH